MLCVKLPGNRVYLPGAGYSEPFCPPWAECVALAICKGPAVAKGAFFNLLRRVLLRACPKSAFPANILKESSFSGNLRFSLPELLVGFQGLYDPSIGLWVLCVPPDFQDPLQVVLGYRGAQSCK